MTASFRVISIEDDRALGAVLVGVVTRGSLMVGMQTILDGMATSIKELLSLEQEVVSAVAKGGEARVALDGGVRFEKLYNYIGQTIDFSDQQRRTSKNLKLRPTVA